jgi:hypothetical protein
MNADLVAASTRTHVVDLTGAQLPVRVQYLHRLPGTEVDDPFERLAAALLGGATQQSS